MRHPSTDNRRRVLFVDRDVQGAIIKRVLLYWFACLLFVTLPVILAMTLSQPTVFWANHVPTVFARFWPLYAMMLILLPFLIRDALSLSHRFCGPVSRLTKGLNDYVETGVYDEIRFRDQDFWKPLASVLNTAMQRSTSIEPSEGEPATDGRMLVGASDQD